MKEQVQGLDGNNSNDASYIENWLNRQVNKFYGTVCFLLPATDTVQSHLPIDFFLKGVEEESKQHPFIEFFDTISGRFEEFEQYKNNHGELVSQLFNIINTETTGDDTNQIETNLINFARKLVQYNFNKSNLAHLINCYREPEKIMSNAMKSLRNYPCHIHIYLPYNLYSKNNWNIGVISIRENFLDYKITIGSYGCYGESEFPWSLYDTIKKRLIALGINGNFENKPEEIYNEVLRPFAKYIVSKPERESEIRDSNNNRVSVSFLNRSFLDISCKESKNSGSTNHGFIQFNDAIYNMIFSPSDVNEEKYISLSNDLNTVSDLKNISQWKYSKTKVLIQDLSGKNENYIIISPEKNDDSTIVFMRVDTKRADLNKPIERFMTGSRLFGSKFLVGYTDKNTKVYFLDRNPFQSCKTPITKVVVNEKASLYESTMWECQTAISKMIGGHKNRDRCKQISYQLPEEEYYLAGVSMLMNKQLTQQAFEQYVKAVYNRVEMHKRVIRGIYRFICITVKFESPFEFLNIAGRNPGQIIARITELFDVTDGKTLEEHWEDERFNINSLLTRIINRYKKRNPLFIGLLVQLRLQLERRLPSYEECDDAECGLLIDIINEIEYSKDVKSSLLAKNSDQSRKHSGIQSKSSLSVFKVISLFSQFVQLNELSIQNKRENVCIIFHRQEMKLLMEYKKYFKNDYSRVCGLIFEFPVVAKNSEFLTTPATPLFYLNFESVSSQNNILNLMRYPFQDTGNLDEFDTKLINESINLCYFAEEKVRALFGRRKHCVLENDESYFDEIYRKENTSQCPFIDYIESHEFKGVISARIRNVIRCSIDDLRESIDLSEEELSDEQLLQVFGRLSRYSVDCRNKDQDYAPLCFDHPEKEPSSTVYRDGGVMNHRLKNLKNIWCFGLDEVRLTYSRRLDILRNCSLFEKIDNEKEGFNVRVHQFKFKSVIIMTYLGLEKNNVEVISEYYDLLRGKPDFEQLFRYTVSSGSLKGITQKYDEFFLYYMAIMILIVKGEKDISCCKFLVDSCQSFTKLITYNTYVTPRILPKVLLYLSSLCDSYLPFHVFFSCMVNITKQLGMEERLTLYLPEIVSIRKYRDNKCKIAWSFFSSLKVTPKMRLMPFILNYTMLRRTFLQSSTDNSEFILTPGKVLLGIGADPKGHTFIYANWMDLDGDLGYGIYHAAGKNHLHVNQVEILGQKNDIKSFKIVIEQLIAGMKGSVSGFNFNRGSIIENQDLTAFDFLMQIRSIFTINIYELKAMKKKINELKQGRVKNAMFGRDSIVTSIYQFGYSLFTPSDQNDKDGMPLRTEYAENCIDFVIDAVKATGNSTVIEFIDSLMVMKYGKWFAKLPSAIPNTASISELSQESDAIAQKILCDRSSDNSRSLSCTKK